MMLEIGTCAGIENYSRHLAGREAGERPACLFDYFPEDFLVVVDESHVSLPQIGGMFNGDRARKLTLVEYGFRLPSALDNRPLMFDEFLALTPRAVFVSATPGELELRLSEGVVVEQIIRPTGLIDPEIEIRPVRGQVDDLLNEIRMRERQGERVLVTTLTKRMSEDLTDYLQQVGVRVRYMHSDIDAIERMEIIRGLRLGEFDVLVGINLLREGLDLPEVSLVAILDADQEGFLRSDRSLIQTVGRAARHVHGRAIFYADRITGSMQRCMEETARRREIQTRAQRRARHHADQRQQEHRPGAVHHARRRRARRRREEKKVAEPARGYAIMETESLEKMLEEQMREAAAAMDFELAAQLRDQLFEVRRASATRPRKSKAGGGVRPRGGRLECRTNRIIPPLAAHGGSRATRRSSSTGASGSAASAQPPLVVTISGELGAGKTTLVQAICRGYGVTDDVTSPTFALVHRYAAPRSPVFHLDLYRLDDADRARRTSAGTRSSPTRRSCSSSGPSARAIGFRATTCRSACSICPTIRRGGCCTPAGTYDHARARRVDVRGRRRRARRRRACSPRRASR